MMNREGAKHSAKAGIMAATAMRSGLLLGCQMASGSLVDGTSNTVATLLHGVIIIHPTFFIDPVAQLEDLIPNDQFRVI